VLTPRQHWLLSTHQFKTVSLDDPQVSSPAIHPVDPGNSPETTTEINQEHSRLQTALALLSPRQRLLLKLRYQQELSLKEVAHLTRLGDPFRARRHIQSALAELAKLLDPSSLKKLRKSNGGVREYNKEATGRLFNLLYQDKKWKVIN